MKEKCKKIQYFTYKTKTTTKFKVAAKTWNTIPSERKASIKRLKTAIDFYEALGTSSSNQAVYLATL